MFQINEFNHLDVIFPGLSTIYPQVPWLNRCAMYMRVTSDIFVNPYL